MRWKDIVRSPKTPLRLAKEYLTSFSGDETDGGKGVWWVVGGKIKEVWILKYLRENARRPRSPSQATAPIRRCELESGSQFEFESVFNAIWDFQERNERKWQFRFRVNGIYNSAQNKHSILKKHQREWNHWVRSEQGDGRCWMGGQNAETPWISSSTKEMRNCRIQVPRRRVGVFTVSQLQLPRTKQMQSMRRAKDQKKNRRLGLQIVWKFELLI